MAMYRKLGKKADQRKALLRSQVTQLIYNGKIKTTDARAKEVRKIAEHLITLAIQEKDNYEEVTVKAKEARKDKDGKRVKEVVDGKKVTVYDEVEKTVKKDKPSRLHARREMLKVLYPVSEIPEDAEGKKEARIAEAEGQASRFEQIYEQYKQYPLITKKRMFYETMEDLLPGMKIIITDGDTQTMYPLDSFVNISGYTTGTTVQSEW